MILYLMRHGIAVDTSPTGRDADRVLTPEGIERTTMVAAALSRIGVGIDRIVSSPYARAVETAEIVARCCGVNTAITTDHRLVPHGRFEEFNDVVGEHRDASALLITGHEPSMGRFISGLAAGGALTIDVKKASVTAVDVSRFRPTAAGTLLWSLPPRILDELTRPR